MSHYAKLSPEQEKAHEKLIKNPIYQWGLFNFDNFYGAYRTMQEARKHACWVNHDKPWSETKQMFQIHHVKIIVSR